MVPVVSRADGAPRLGPPHGPARRVSTVPSGSQTIRITRSPSAIWEAITTHRQLDDAALARVGISPEIIRLSIGIEHIDDIDQALDA